MNFKLFNFISSNKLKIEIMNKIRLEIVVQSHLSDAAIEIEIGQSDMAKLRLRFVKFLVNKFKGDLTSEQDPNILFEEFSN